mmetsp:Transcript_4428/g.14299  ORF Transcript_4428/g.14299 Transcript_4428/m.14299 type:complete len:99 (+) Transcript_4428:261-557(+)
MCLFPTSRRSVARAVYLVPSFPVLSPPTRDPSSKTKFSSSRTQSRSCSSKRTFGWSQTSRPEQCLTDDGVAIAALSLSSKLQSSGDHSLMNNLDITDS